MISDNIACIRENISRVCQKLGRNPDEITLVAVTKFASLSLVQEAIRQGIRDVGENKVQEALKKFTVLESPAVRKHMIGHLQTNKAKQALEIFDLIQSVDSLKLAREIQKQAAKLNKTAEILIQVNTAGEQQKFGADPREVSALLAEVLKFSNILVKGFMTIAPLTGDKDSVRCCFEDLRKLSERAQNEFRGSARFDPKHLSMGMTDDYEIALEEGSNMVRIGRAIFS
jgi:hypothetical protein